MPHSRPVVGIRLPIWAGSTAPVLGGVADYMRKHSHWRIETLNDSYGEMEKVEITVGWQGDGLILYRATAEELEDFKQRGIAVVLLSTEGPDLGYPRILPDNEAAGEIAAAHLLSLGLNSFAYLARGETLYRQKEYISGTRIYSRERLVGYKSALAKSGCEPAVHMLPGFPLWKKESWKRIEKAVEKFLVKLPEKTGLFAVDDALASVALRVAERVGIAVPQSLAVLGFGDDLNYCHASLPTLSSIPYPARTIGYAAAKCLTQQMKTHNLGSEIRRIPIESVHRRESTDFLAIADEETARLVRWIRKSAPNLAIRIEDLLEQTPYSHSTVKMKFKQHLGHSPKKEISRTRLTHLKFLLDDPSLSLAEITSMMQFASTHELGRFFMRETGERPTVYRTRKKG
ncbi:MAG: substrate-binding domain-containing protein [Akkermansiaceae bacterium]